MQQSDILEDSIDDIISILQGQPTISIKNVQQVGCVAKSNLQEEPPDSLDEFRNSHTKTALQNQTVNLQNLSSPVTYQPNNIIRRVGAIPSFQSKPKQLFKLQERASSQTKQINNSAQKNYNNTSILQENVPALIRFLAFKPYSGLPIDSAQLKDNGYTFKSFGGGHVKLIKCTLEENGFTETQGKNWTLLWNSGPIKSDVYPSLFAYQKVCHFPKSYEMTRKDLMHRNISKMQISHGFSNFNFIPKTYILPAEMSFFLEEHEKLKSQNPVYICKPHASSQGKGIFVTDRIQEILSKQNNGNSYVVSHYIQNPMLVNGLKFDLRIYVAVTCINPLRIYIYEDGLARFATIEYSLDLSGGNRFVHLTNYAVQKESPNFVTNSDPSLDHVGSKWSLVSLLEYLKLHGVNVQQLLERIDDIIIKTVISVETLIFNACEMHVPYRSNCFSLFGFDILLDQNSRPWLLEVNLSPSLNIDAPIDLKIKGEMIADLFTLVGVVPLDQRFSIDQSYIKNTNSFANDKKNTQQNGFMTAFEKYIIRESEEENRRSRKWRKIYPNENSGRYKNYFEQDRVLNIVLRNHEYERSRILSQSSNSQSQQKKQQQLNTFAQAGRQKLGL